MHRSTEDKLRELEREHQDLIRDILHAAEPFVHHSAHDDPEVVIRSHHEGKHLQAKHFHALHGLHSRLGEKHTHKAHSKPQEGHHHHPSQGVKE